MWVLKQLRQTFGFTQTVLADKMQVNQQTIARWEKGKTEPSIKQIKKLASMFNVSTDLLLEHDSPAAITGTLCHIMLEQLNERQNVNN